MAAQLDFFTVPPPSAPSGPLFGVVIPGRPLMTDFQVVDTSKAIALLEQPGSIAELSFFLLPTTLSILPPNHGAILYYSVPPFQHWEIIGSVEPSRPSGIFRTGWVTHEEVRVCPVLQLGVSIEP